MRRRVVLSVSLVLISCSSSSPGGGRTTEPRDPGDAVALPGGPFLQEEPGRVEPTPTATLAPSVPVPQKRDPLPYVSADAPFVLASSCREIRGLRGETLTLSVTIHRRADVGAAIELTAVNLPAGVTSVPVHVPVGATSAEVLLHVSPSAPVAVRHPARLSAYAVGGKFASAPIPIDVEVSSHSMSPLGAPAISSVVPGSEGALDLSFGSAGVSRVASWPEAITALGDGGVAFAADVGARCGGVVKLDAHGNIDPSFGEGGKFIADMHGYTWVRDVTTQVDQKLIVAGFVKLADGPWSKGFVSRLLPDGGLDPTFGENGTRLIDVGGQDWISHAAIDPAGRILVAGSTSAVPRGFFVARLLSSGAIDTSFGSNGKVLIADVGYPRGVETGTDGKILVVAHVMYGNRTVAFRFDDLGSLDPDFGNGGRLDVGAGYPVGFALDSAGRLLILRDSGAQGAGEVRRFLSTGALDASFGSGSGGGSIVRFGPGANVFHDLLLRDDAILLAGAHAQSSAIARLDGNGVLDAEFGDGGIRFYDLGGASLARRACFSGEDQVFVGGLVDAGVNDGLGNMIMGGYLVRLWL